MVRADAVVHVEVACSTVARQVQVVALTLPAASTVRDALQASGLPQRDGLALDAAACGVWGRRCTLAQVLRDGDRVELYRPLMVDPKEARRLRYNSARRRNGLHKHKRPARAGR
jgi:putative ubiquitin-RnfH superfamily antitoxin RatB of RatAB toxin-antitoxin module